MVNAQNLKAPPSYIDTKELVRLGLLDPVLQQPNNFDFGGLGFTPREYHPAERTFSPSPDPRMGAQQFDPNDLSRNLERLMRQREENQKGIVTDYDEKGRVKQPSIKSPKKITDSQAGIGAGVALLLRLAGASHESVTGAYANYLGGVSKRNAEEAELSNAQEAMNYKASMQRISDDIEKRKETNSILNSQIDDTRQIYNDAQQRVDEIAKGKTTLATNAVNKINELRASGNLTPGVLATLSKIAGDNGGMYYDPAVESHADIVAEAERNFKVRRNKEDSEAVKLANDLLQDQQSIQKGSLDIAEKVLDNQIKTASKEDILGYYDLRRRRNEIAAEREELILKDLPRKLRDDAKAVRERLSQAWARIAIARQNANRLASGEASSKDPLAKDVRDQFNAIREIRQKIKGSGLAGDKKGTTYYTDWVNGLKELEYETMNLIDSIQDPALKKKLIEEGVRRDVLPKSALDQYKQISHPG